MRPLRIAQASDFHLTCPTYNPFRLCSKRLLGTINWLVSRKKTFSRKSVDALPELLKSLDVDHILLGGDFTTTSLPSEYKLAVDFVSKLPAPWIAIPGNHDCYTQRAFRRKHFYRNLSNRAGLFSLANDGAEAHLLAPGWWAVLLDTARPTWGPSARGLFSKKLEARLLALLSQIPQEDSILMLNHYPFFQNDTHSHNLERGEALQAILRKDLRIKAYLHGHTHRHIIANLQDDGLPVILDSGASADSKNGSWQLLTIDDMGMQVDVYRWDGAWVLNKVERIAWSRGLQMG